MKNIFRYDYNNKVFMITLSVSFAFLGLSVITFPHTIGFTISIICTALSFFNSFIVIRNQGIRIHKKTKRIIIIDDLLVRKFDIKDIMYVTLKEINKETKSNWYGFFFEFFYPYTYMSHCKYVYNQGKVYTIRFCMRDGIVYESYFGWLYKEKKKKVEQVESDLLKFIKSINTLCVNSKKQINS